jgi:ABC-type nitrate/sulfonate/bicarbonate transport system substrate-binding protein
MDLPNSGVIPRSLAREVGEGWGEGKLGGFIRTGLLFVFCVVAQVQSPLQAQEKIRVGYIGLSLSSMPILAARDLGTFAKNGLQAELVLLTFQLSSIAMSGGELDYVAGVGPGTVSATLGGNPMRAVWIVANRLIYNVVAQPELKTLQDLRGKRIGVSGLGATTHTAFNMGVEKSGVNPKDFVVVALGPQQQLRAMESRAVDAVMIDPPVLFVLLKKGFSKVFDVGAAVEMPVGGLTTMTRTLSARPDQARRVIKALQEAKELLLNSRERAVEFIVKTMKMDHETATKTHELMAFAWAGSGVPTAAGMGNIVRGIQSQGRFAERKVAFEEIADPRIAQQVARELGH